MRAVVLDKKGLRLVPDYVVPELRQGWARIRVRKAGICGTDLEILQGYKAYQGIVGHEFVGVVDRCEDSGWVGKRVVGEINVGCGRCDWCGKGLGRHCPDRTVLGIRGLDGCMAKYCTLPIENLRVVPPAISEERAVFIEPISAACEILEQLRLSGTEKIVVLGDGRLGILCAWVLATVSSDVTLVGRHAEKLDVARWRHLETALDPHALPTHADVVVEATGSADGIDAALSLCRPRGTVVLKTTVAARGSADLSSLVVNAQRIVGSRCGRFEDGIGMLESHPDMPVERLITARFPIEQAERAFARAAEPGALKVLIAM